MKLVYKILALIIVISILFVSIIFINISLAKGSEPQKSDTIIVLGCQVKGKNLSLSLQYRMEKALEIYQQALAKNIIVSGGQGPGEDLPESTAMKDWLVSKGVDEDIIYEENKSTSTYENLLNSKKIMIDNNLKSAIIISNDFHIYRSLSIARRLDIIASGAPAQTVSYLKFYSNCREILSVVKSFIFDR